MPERSPLPQDLSAHAIEEIARAVAERRLPPVESWNPAHCGDSRMRIARDGTWYHDGEAIRRPAMVRLFSTILRREADGRHVLVTPAEKLDIAVEDAAFVAVEVKSEGAGRERRLAFRLNTDEAVVAGPGHPLSLRDGHPYLAVRGRLEALVARPVYYELAEIALADAHGLWSDGVAFALEAA